MATDNEVLIAKLNDLTDVLANLSTSNVRASLGIFRNPGIAAEGCTGNCDCRGGYCGCNASVTANQRFDMSFPEFMVQREGRIHELQEQLQGLQLPAHLSERKS